MDNIPPPMPQPIPAKTSGLAIAALVLGVLALCSCGLTGIFGLIIGIVALVKIKNSGGWLKGEGMAIAGIVVSACFLFFSLLFLGLLLPALASAKGRAQTIRCVSNEKQLALAMTMYCEDNTNQFPAAAAWCDAIHFKVSRNAFRCPAANPASRCDYAFNAALGGLDRTKVDPHTVMLFESDGGWNANGGAELVVRPARHVRGRIVVVAEVDGSVHQVRESDLGSLRWNP